MAATVFTRANLASRDALVSAAHLAALNAADGIVQATIPRTAYVQTHATAARTVPAATAVGVVTTPAALTSYGFSEAQANGIVADVNANAADIEALKQVVNSIIDDLQAMGLVG